jgi:Fe2+ or Zn2+ uptake regulation protein
MEKTETILTELKSRGYRKSRAREAMLAILEASSSPLSAPDIEVRLLRRGHRFNKTTVYREIECLMEAGYVTELALRNDVALYELAGPHHHHLICVDCGDVRDIDSGESFADEERLIERREGFRILDHSLEFFGLCGKCR